VKEGIYGYDVEFPPKRPQGGGSSCKIARHGRKGQKAVNAPLAMEEYATLGDVGRLREGEQLLDFH